jgi:DNA-directed RNA polymerase subunit RPC12/RpoP
MTQQTARMNKYTCRTCSGTFLTEQQLIEHRRIHEDSEANEYRCSVCGEAFATESKLAEHAKTHAGLPQEA